VYYHNAPCICGTRSTNDMPSVQPHQITPQETNIPTSLYSNKRKANKFTISSLQADTPRQR